MLSGSILVLLSKISGCSGENDKKYLLRFYKCSIMNRGYVQVDDILSKIIQKCETLKRMLSYNI